MPKWQNDNKKLAEKEKEKGLARELIEERYKVAQQIVTTIETKNSATIVNKNINH